MGTTFAEPAATTTRPPAVELRVAAAASAGAGLVHAAAAGSHGGGRLTVVFALTAAAQVAWAAVAARRTTPAVAATGLLLAATTVAAWALTRTTGLLLLGELGAPEAVGAQDLAAAALGTVAAAGCLLGLLRPGRHGRPAGPGGQRARDLGTLAVAALAVVGMVAGHDHGDHGAGEGAAGHQHGPGEEGDGGPVISLDDPRLTSAQRGAATELIEVTTAAAERFPDVASVEAAGYTSIGDGITGFEHFVHRGHLADGVDLDPERIESMVFRVGADGSRELISAMYILSPGATMDDVPDIAGELTTWHDHQDLCWNELGRVVARAVDGVCPAGVLRATAPMLHVWLEEHPCGPFAGLEGHGSGCSHDH